MEDQAPITHDNIPIVFESNEDFASLYANNVMLETSVWDLKMIFGQLEQRDKVRINQHTAITIPWLQAKLLIYTLQVNVEIFEAQHGKIKIPDGLMPPEPKALPGVDGKEDDIQLRIVRKVRDVFIASLK